MILPMSAARSDPAGDRWERVGRRIVHWSLLGIAVTVTYCWCVRISDDLSWDEAASYRRYAHHPAHRGRVHPRLEQPPRGQPLPEPRLRRPRARLAGVLSLRRIPDPPRIPRGRLAVAPVPDAARGDFRSDGADAAAVPEPRRPRTGSRACEATSRPSSSKSSTSSSSHVGPGILDRRTPGADEAAPPPSMTRAMRLKLAALSGVMLFVLQSNVVLMLILWPATAMAFGSPEASWKEPHGRGAPGEHEARSPRRRGRGDPLPADLHHAGAWEPHDRHAADPRGRGRIPHSSRSGTRSCSSSNNAARAVPGGRRWRSSCPSRFGGLVSRLGVRSARGGAARVIAAPRPTQARNADGMVPDPADARGVRRHRRHQRDSAPHPGSVRRADDLRVRLHVGRSRQPLEPPHSGPRVLDRSRHGLRCTRRAGPSHGLRPARVGSCRLHPDLHPARRATRPRRARQRSDPTALSAPHFWRPVDDRRAWPRSDSGSRAWTLSR